MDKVKEIRVIIKKEGGATSVSGNLLDLLDLIRVGKMQQSKDALKLEVGIALRLADTLFTSLLEGNEKNATYLAGAVVHELNLIKEGVK